MYFKAEGNKQVQCEDNNFTDLKPDQLVWKEGMAGWERADKVFPEVFAEKFGLSKANKEAMNDKPAIVNIQSEKVIVSDQPKQVEKPVEASVEVKQAVQAKAQELLNKMDEALPPNDIFEGADWRGYAICIEAWTSKLQKANQNVKITVIFVPDEKPRFKAMVS